MRHEDTINEHRCDGALTFVMENSFYPSECQMLEFDFSPIIPCNMINKSLQWSGEVAKVGILHDSNEMNIALITWGYR